MMTPGRSAKNHADAMSTAGDSSALRTSASPTGASRGERLRTWVGFLLGFAATAFLVSSILIGIRPTLLAVTRFAYTVYDPFTQEDQIDFGPRAPSTHGQTASEIEQRLSEHYPRFTFHVSQTSRLPQNIDGINFQHESLKDSGVTEFMRMATPILEGSKDIFEIASRVRGITEHGTTSRRFDDNNPVEIMRVATSGEPLTCRPFSLLFGACVVELGYSSRLLGLSKDGRRFDHAVTEVYSPVYGKWVVIDTDFNIAYRRQGIWLNAAELHDLWIKLRQLHPDKPLNHDVLDKVDPAVTRDIREVLKLDVVVLGKTGEPLRQNNLALHGTGIGLEFYEYVVYHARNNFLGAEYPKGHPKRSFQYIIQPPERNLPPAMCPEATPAPDRQVLYFPVGRSELSLGELTNDSSIPLVIHTWTPNFSHFEARINSGDWHKLDAPNLTVNVTPGVHRVEARSVNLAGLRGEVAVWVVNILPTATESPHQLETENSP